MKKPPGCLDDSNALKQTYDSINEVWGERTPHKGGGGVAS